MIVKLKLVDGTEFNLENQTRIFAWKSGEPKEFYGKGLFRGTVDELGVPSEPYKALVGLFGNADWFSVNSPETIYKTSSIVSLELIR